MKKLHISGKRKALGALLASLIIGVSSTAALAEEAGDLSVFDENDAELSIWEESSLITSITFIISVILIMIITFIIFVMVVIKVTILI